MNHVPAFRRLIMASALIAPLLNPSAAHAAEEAGPTAAETGTTDVIVTAQRRPERIQSIPIAITALDERAIVGRKLDDVKDLVIYTPGFSGNSDDSFIDGLAIRGIVSNDYGIGGDPSIGIFKDGIYQGRTGSAVTSLFDIERAEALRGPQGFLFGRNAISGAISVVTNKPSLDRVEGHVYLGAGERERVEAEGALNLPLGGGWAIRLAGYHESADGWVDNAFTPGRDDRLMGTDKTAGRASVLFADGPLRVVATGEFERRHLGGTPYRASNNDRGVFDAIDAALGTTLVIRGGPRDVDTDLTDPKDEGTIFGGTVQADLELGVGTLTSVTGYRRHRYFYSEDYDGTPLLLGDYTQRQHGTYASEEVRLVSKSGVRLTWSAGVSGYRETVAARFGNEADESAVCRAGYGYRNCRALTRNLYGIRYLPAPGGVLIDVNDARTINTGWSVYGDGNWRATSKLQLGLGIRYTWDHKDFGLDILPSASTLGNIWSFTYYTDGFVNAGKSWKGVTPRAFARYEIRKALSIYASVTRGYKSGGFGSFTVAAPSAIEDFRLVPAGTRPDDFAPETIWSEELGIKGALFGERLRFDVTAFHYLYRNLQTNYFDPETRTQQVINVGRVRGQGLEAEATWRPTRFFDVSGNVAYTHTAKRGDRDCLLRDCGGLPNPEWASSGVATAHYPIGATDLYLSGEWAYEGVRRESFDWRGVTRRNAYTAANLRLGYRSAKGWEAVAYVENVLDAIYYHGAENNGELTPANVWGVSEPRTVGVNLRWSFGA